MEKYELKYIIDKDSNIVDTLIIKRIRIMTKICTSIEQSKKLIELGLDVNTADMWWAERYEGYVELNGEYVVEETPYYYLSLTKPSENNYSQDRIKDIPAWSLSALIGLMPERIKINGELSFCLTIKKSLLLHRFTYNTDETTFCDNNVINAAYEMVVWLLEKGYINKD